MGFIRQHIYNAHIYIYYNFESLLIIILWPNKKPPLTTWVVMFKQKV